MYLYIITYDCDGSVWFFKRLEENELTGSICHFGIKGKPKIYDREEAAKKVVKKITENNLNTNLGFSLFPNDMDIKIKEIDLATNMIMDIYIY